MSWEAEHWARQQRTGDPVTKAVLVGIANWMNPRGDECFVSVRRIADEVEVSTRTVQRHILRLEEIGLLERIERQREDGGQGWSAFRFPTYKPVKVSHVDPPVILSRPRDNLSYPPDDVSYPPDDLTQGGRQPCHGEGDTAVTPESEERNKVKAPLPPKGGGDGKAEHERAKRDRGERISETWEPPAIADLPSAVRAKARQWPDGAYHAEAEAFRDYWLGEGRAGARKMDWNRAWYNRINEATARVLRDAKAGVRFEPPPVSSGNGIRPTLDTSGECDSARAIRAQIAKAVPKAEFAIWFEPTRLDVNGTTLTVTAPSDMMSSYHRSNFDIPIRRALAAVLGKGADLRWRVERPAQ
ncbi:helix-turn-helix domain-containing protein [Sphingobium sufflavum]|uniref:helix-turn-helix domain-containing protein n=1 Tax=Sphingobium sufflavum TaxID=1129547 RepID=UPI001F1A7E1A|nr:helix-turn-helix domain-containing protein [Sphingobium sufflavum]MCE7797870.1 helix-turn-helix domain-containing protein [Sphingobium sufflavum]